MLWQSICFSICPCHAPSFIHKYQNQSAHSNIHIWANGFLLLSLVLKSRNEYSKSRRYQLQIPREYIRILATVITLATHNFQCALHSYFSQLKYHNLVLRHTYLPEGLSYRGVSQASSRRTPLPQPAHSIVCFFRSRILHLQPTDLRTTSNTNLISISIHHGGRISRFPHP